MKTNSNYKFQVSLSKDSYSDKIISGAMIGSTKNVENRKIRKEYGYKANMGIGFEEITVTCDSLLNSLLDGKVFCHLFNPKSFRKDGTFASNQKCNDNFKGSFVIGVDIDHTNYKSAEEFISKLSLKPSFYYTSYSNMQLNEDGTSKGARFRLIYVLDTKINNPYLFRYCAYQLNKIIEKDTEEIIDDDCNLRCSQYFNGTNRSNPNIILNYGITSNIYSFEDINSNGNGFVDFLIHYGFYKTVTITRTKEIKELLFLLTNQEYVFNKSIKLFELRDSINISTTLNDETEKEGQSKFEVEGHVNSDFSKSVEYLLNDWDRLEVEEFLKCSEWEQLRRNTKYIYRIEKDWINNTYQYVDSDYFSLFYYCNTVMDGSKRRKSLYQRMCLRRIINPSITKDEMVVNTIIDIVRFFDNSDSVLNSDFIRRNINACFELELDDIEKQYADSISYLKESTKPKRGIIYYNKQAHSKSTTFYILDELYNVNLSVKANLDILNNELGYKIAKTTVYEYLKERDFKPVVVGKLTDEELTELIDVNLSVRKNLEILKDNNINVGKDRISKLLNNKKNINNNISINNSIEDIQVLITTINVKTEKEGHSEIQKEFTSKVENIESRDFCKCKNAIDDILSYLEINQSNFDMELITSTLRPIEDKIRTNSAFLADTLKNGVNKIFSYSVA